MSDNLTTYATCWLITRTDDVQFAFTDHDQPLTIDGVTYQPGLSYTRTAIRTSSDLTVDNLEAQGVMDSSEITDADLRAGLFNHAAVQICTVDWQALTVVKKNRSGWLGKVTVQQNKFQAELRGLTQALQTKRGRCYSPTCRADLGDGDCGVPLGALTRDDISMDAATKTLTTAAANFVGTNLVPGYAVGQPLSITGFGNAGNNQVLTITALTAKTLTFAGAEGLVNEAAGADVSISLAQTGTVTAVTSGRAFAASGLVGGLVRNISYTASTISFVPKNYGGRAGSGYGNSIQDTARGFVAAGFQAGDQISASGSGDNDQLYTIQAIIVLDWVQEIIVDETLVYDGPGEPVTIATINPDWFAFGLLTWLTGQNAGLTAEVRSWDGTNVNLFLSVPYTIQVGDTFSIVPGCDKRLNPSCLTKFDNILNFRGEPSVPGQDAVLYYPDAT
jgi:uncharacterized phage protein (TIGR02218 family)